MASSEELHRSFSSLMVSLHKAGNKARVASGQRTVAANAVAASVVPQVRLLDDRSLAASLKPDKGQLNGAVTLAPPNTSFEKCLILLWAEWDFSGDRSRAKLEVGFIRSRNDAHYFRYENAPANSRHRYWHSQYCNRFSTLNTPQSTSTLNQSVPAFPLACNDSAGLLVACAVSVYGADIDADVKTKINSMALSDSYLRQLLAQ